jgi:hypothetical protein
MSSFLKTPEQRIDDYNTKGEYVDNLRNQIFNYNLEPYIMELSGVNQKHICANKPTVFEKVVCIDNPKLTEDFMQLVKEHDKNLTEYQAMQLGG